MSFKLIPFGPDRKPATAFGGSRARLLRFAFVLVSALLAASCSSDSRSPSPLGIGNGGRSSLRFAPQYSSLAAGSSSAPINRIHLVARVVGTGVVVADTTIDNVDPSAPQWSLTIDLNLTGGADVVVLISLINVTNGVAETQWSGETQPVHVTPGVSTTDPTPLVLYRGPPENLTVTAVRITRPIPPLTEGGDVQLAATVQGGGPTTQVFWTALDGGVATISGGGLVHTLSAGIARFVASAGPRADTVAITVAQRIASVAVTPSTLTLESFGAETDFTARVLDPRGVVIPGATVVWRTLNAGVAQQVSGARFRAVTNGLATIEAAAVGAPTVVGTAALTVSQRVATVQLTPPSATLNAVGATVTFTPVAKDANGNVVAGAVFTFSSSLPAVATVTNGGVARAVSNGATNIQATTPAGGAAPVTATVSATAPLTVLQSVARIEVSATPDVIDAIGGTSTAAAVAKDASGNTVAGQTFVFSSTDAGVLSVNATTGAITAVGRGQAYVRATSGSVSGTALVSVEQRVTIVSISPTSANASYFGQQVQFTATPRDRNRNPVPGRSVTWSSSTPGVATVSSTGLATAVARGTTQINANVDGVGASATFTVAPTASTVVVSPSSANIPSPGGTRQFSAVATDSHGNAIPGVVFTWSSSAPSVATINSSTGLATAVSSGSTTITARADSASGNATLTVGSVVINGNTESFPDPLGGWKTRFMGLYSNMVNYYNVGCSSACNENYRGNNADGLWMSDGVNDVISRIRFNAQFAAQLTGFSIDLGAHVAARIKIYDKDLHVLLDEAVLATGCSNCATREGPGSGNRYVTYAATSTNGIGGFDIVSTNTTQVEGNIGIDNIVISTSPNPGTRFTTRGVAVTPRTQRGFTGALPPDGVNAADDPRPTVRRPE